MRAKTSAAIAALLLVACSDQSTPPAIEIEDGWVRAAAAGQSTTAAYVTISNRGGAATLSPEEQDRPALDKLERITSA